MTFMKNIFCIVLLCAAAQASAQKYHTAAELLKIAEKSQITYQIEKGLKQPVTIDFENRLNINDSYRSRIMPEGTIITMDYRLSKEGAKLEEEAEKLFQLGDTDGAKKKYMEVLRTDPQYYKVMTYIGQCYGIEKNWVLAKEWYKRAIQNNYIDYMAHWFLGDVFFQEGETENALREMIVAKVMNRNNPRIQQSLDKMLAAVSLQYDKWEFVPQYTVDKVNEKEVSVRYTDEWLIYALCKAIWQYEPGYRESMGITGAGTSSTEETECMLCHFTSYSTDAKTAKLPYMKALLKAMDLGMYEEYIVYEVLLPQHPALAYQLEENMAEEIYRYVMEVRIKK